MTSLNELEPAVWSQKQFGACELGDIRRTQRLVRYAEQMAEKPDASTPQQTENWGDWSRTHRCGALRAEDAGGDFGRAHRGRPDPDDEGKIGGDDGIRRAGKDVFLTVLFLERSGPFVFQKQVEKSPGLFDFPLPAAAEVEDQGLRAVALQPRSRLPQRGWRARRELRHAQVADLRREHPRRRSQGRRHLARQRHLVRFGGVAAQHDQAEIELENARQARPAA